MKKADLVICISNNTKKDLLKFFPEVDENKIKVVYNGVSNLLNLWISQKISD
ncbi:glycosyltransferase [Kaistella anthropi]|nr:glycosyltransferase [Kaistella anthropi]